ncbi:MAG: hypothetical protein K0U78_04175 [Actinomycetia bacterium]|nr:hypothetical protein [Actinomycetes bacterium]
MASIALYRALVEAKVSEPLASEAVQELESDSKDLQSVKADLRSIRVELKHIQWTQGVLIAVSIAILAKLFID